MEGMTWKNPRNSCGDFFWRPGQGGRLGGGRLLFYETVKIYSSKVFVFIEFHYLCIPKIFGVVLYWHAAIATLAQLVEQLICNQ